jgi:hypothetical protein
MLEWELDHLANADDHVREPANVIVVDGPLFHAHGTFPHFDVRVGGDLHYAFLGLRLDDDEPELPERVGSLLAAAKVPEDVLQVLHHVIIGFDVRAVAGNGHVYE